MFGGFFPSLNKMKGLTFPWGKKRVQKAEPYAKHYDFQGSTLCITDRYGENDFEPGASAHPNSN